MSCIICNKYEVLNNVDKVTKYTTVYDTALQPIQSILMIKIQNLFST